MDQNPVLFDGRPEGTLRPQQQAIYDRLEELHIPFLRADHDAADTMEACAAVESTLGARICKNLFLCNRQETEFRLLLMPGGKPFKTKYLSSQLGCSRLSFASPEHMARLLRTVPGSVSPLELIFDTENRIRLVMDEELLEWDYICVHPGFSTSTLRLTREDLLRLCAENGHDPVFVRLPREEGAE